MKRKKVVTPREGLGLVNRLLSEAQDVIGQYVSTVESKESAPASYKLGDKVWVEIEKTRQLIAGWRR